MTMLQDILAAVGWQTRVNENFRSVSPAGLYGINPATTTGLTFGYLGGEFNGITVLNGAVTLAASSTNYVVAERASGVVSTSTGTTNWANTAGYMRLYQISTGPSTMTIGSSSDKRQSYGGSGGGGSTIVAIPIACSDETTSLTTGAAKVTFRMPFALSSVSVRASLTTAQTSGSIFTVDVNESGTSILSTKLTVDNGEKTSTTAATPPVVSDSSLADDAEITIDIDQIGDGTAKGLKVYIIGTP